MAGFRHSTAPSANPKLTTQPSRPRSVEAEARKLAGKASVDGTLLLVGGCDLTHFRLRVAQSHVRGDMAPSFWSHVGILCEEDSGLVLYEAALDPPAGFQEMPKSNGVQRGSAARYEDETLFPNLALLRFPVPKVESSPRGRGSASGPGPSQIPSAIKSVCDQRGVLDIPSLVLPWLGFVWGAGMPTNPLVAGTGIPGAVFAEAAFAAVGVELTPGLSTRSSCPEAIWQAARWWYPFYIDRGPSEKAAPGKQPSPTADSHPTGTYWLGQPEAAYIERTPPAKTRAPRAK
jgi:hypothetical protein